MTNLRNQKVSPSAPADASSRIDYPDAWRMALVAIAVVGVGFFLCHLPYGRLATVLLCLAGAALAALSVLGLERRPWLGWIGVGLNLLFVVLLVAFPGQFGLQGWWPVRASKSPTPTAGMTADGWVDAGDAGWVEDDVQVALTFAMVGPAPGNAGSKRTETLLWIGVKVTNTGTRTVDFTGWEAETPSSPILTTTSGTNIAARRTDKLTPTKLTQGKFTECLLAFEVPPAGQAIRLELPASAHGGTTPARFQIAPELILRK